MIRIELAPEPKHFDERVRQKGHRALAEMVGEVEGRRKQLLDKDQNPIIRREDIPSKSLPSYWRECADDLLRAYHRICAYACFYIEPVTGASSVDHLVPKSMDWREVYEWRNYRLACSLMNSRKRNFLDVLDPAEIDEDWFRLELVGFQVFASSTLDASTSERVEQTIDRLRLNGREFRELRETYFREYREGEISARYLRRRAPHLAREMERQGHLNPVGV